MMQKRPPEQRRNETKFPREQQEEYLDYFLLV